MSALETMTLAAAKRLVDHMANYPTLSEEEALVDLWHLGVATNETRAAFDRRRSFYKDEDHNVFHDPERFRGWHVFSATTWKPNVYQFTASRSRGAGHEMITGYCSKDVLRVAIELKLCTKSEYVLP